jgi:hypothetical protein
MRDLGLAAKRLRCLAQASEAMASTRLVGIGVERTFGMTALPRGTDSGLPVVAFNGKSVLASKLWAETSATEAGHVPFSHAA